MKSADYKYHALDEERCYTLTPSAGGPAKILATGTGLLTNEFLAKLDTTSLDNGEYELTLLIVNVGDNTTTVSRNITVASDFKLGNFKLSFTDMTIPVSGFPLTVIRSYDSLRAKQDGDFGKGWSLELANTKVEVKYPAGSDGLSSFEGSYTPFRDGTRVVITLPGGKREGFTFFGTPGTQFFGQVFDWIPKFYADAGVTSQLITDQSRLTKTGSGEYLDTESNHGFNPADPVFGGAYTLKLRNGTELAINAETGELASITDLTGNSTLFTGDSIESSAGRRIQFARDWDGRITSVIDSQSGKTVSYAYDGIGNLVSVTDPMQATTQFAYRTDGTNFLDTIIDPFGREAARTEYGANGRVSKVTDAAGKTIEYTYDLDTLVQTVTDQLGNVTTITLNSNGDAVREVGPTGGITKRTFDGDHRVLSETLVVGLEDSGSSETNDLTTSSTFDINGNQLTATDKYGNVTRTGYNGHDQPTSQTDAFGNTNQTNYDSHGLPTSIRDANGNVTSLKFDVRGNPTEIRDDNGNLLVTNAYNQYGEIVTSTSVFGRTTYFDYDLNGNQVASWYFGGSGAEQVQMLNKTTFDELNRSVGTVQAVLPVGAFITANLATATIPAQYVISQNSTVYNAVGQVTSTTDSNGLETQNTYDVRGQLIQTRRESVDENGNTVWLISRTAFDAAGRTIASTSQYVEGTTDPVFGSLSTYDAAGRVTLSEQVIGLVITITGTANNEEAVVMDDGTVISSSATTYATSGQVTSSVDSYGRTSQSTYNEFGDVTESRREAYDENGGSVWFVSRTVYDSFGRTAVSTEEYPEGTSEPIQGTQTVYDQQGRAFRSVQLSGIVVTIESVTGNSTLTIGGTTVSQSQTTYNADGRVAVTTDAYGRESHTTYDSLGRTTQTRRQAVDENGTTVWLVSRTVYDSLGRVDVSTDQYLEGSTGPIYGTRSVYDALGRTVNTVRLEGIAVSINAVTGNSTLTAGGTPLRQTETLYNSDGTVFQQISADGQITEYEYDALRRQVATIGTPVVINGQTVRHRRETVYDGQGRVVQQRTNITQFANGTIDATDVQTTTHEYDSRGNIVKTTFTDNTFVAMAYDDRGRKISETNQMGLTRTFAYDSQARLASVSLPDLDGNSATTNDIATYGYKYDARGNMVQLTDPLGRDTRWTFNDRGQQTSRTLPLGFGLDGMFGTTDDLPPLPPGVGWGEGRFTENMSYDVKGRMTQQTSFEGVITEYVYDDAVNGTGTGRLREKRFYKNQADYDNALISESQTMTYDAFGREVSVFWDRTVSNPGSNIDTWTKRYDVQGRLTRVESPTGDINYEYDVFGRQTRVVTGTTGSYAGDIAVPVTDIRYSYDSLSRLSKIEAFKKNNVPVDVDLVTAGNQPETESYAYTLNGSLDYEVNPDGSTTDYTYDELNRLTDLDEYRASTTTPDVFTNNPKRSEYNYTLRADGKRDSADEIIYSTDGTTPVSHTQFDWTYDNASRLTDEVFTDVGNLMADVDNYHAAFEYDLTGNRLTQTTITDTNHDGVLNAAVDRDEVTTYTSDANDRMLSESTVVDGAATESTAYGFTGTQQTSKTVSPAAGSPLSAVSFSYDLQGRMYRATTETFNAGTLTSRNRATYQYGTDGIRYRAISETDTVLNLTTANLQLTTDTKYLIDANNYTGYQQVLEETVTDGNGNLVKKIVYSIGLDHISQTTFTPDGPAQGVTAVFHMDGHGSTRVLTDLAGAILNIGGVAQIYHYTAYGEAINFQMGNAATQYLYSGEQFDARISQQYLRARYYDQSTGTFNRLDPFFGNVSDPQSFHKYLYTHGNPVNGTDPSGLFFSAVSGLVTTSVRTVMASPRVSASLVVLDRGAMLADGLTIISTLVVGGVIPLPLLAGFLVSLIPGAGLARLGGISWRAMGQLSRIGRFAFSNGDNVASFLSHGGAGKLDDAAEWMSGIYNKLFTSAGERATEFGGELSAALVTQKLGLEVLDDFPHRYHGIDGLYKHGDELVIVEAKGFAMGGSSMLGTTKAGEQLSQGWITRKIERFRELAKDPSQTADMKLIYQKYADDLQYATENDKLKVLLINTEVDKAAGAIGKVDFELRRWENIGDTTFIPQ